MSDIMKDRIIAILNKRIERLQARVEELEKVRDAAKDWQRHGFSVTYGDKIIEALQECE